MRVCCFHSVIAATRQCASGPSKSNIAMNRSGSLARRAARKRRRATASADKADPYRALKEAVESGRGREIARSAYVHPLLGLRPWSSMTEERRPLSQRMNSGREVAGTRRSYDHGSCTINITAPRTTVGMCEGDSCYVLVSDHSVRSRAGSSRPVWTSTQDFNRRAQRPRLRLRAGAA